MARFRVWAQEDTAAGCLKWVVLLAAAQVLWPMVYEAFGDGVVVGLVGVFAAGFLFVSVVSWTGVPIPRCPGNVWVRALLLLPLLFLVACNGTSEIVTTGAVGLAVGTIAGAAVALVEAIGGGGEA